MGISSFRHLAIEVADVARPIRIEQPVAAFHLHHSPLERLRGVLVVRDDRMAQVRQRVVAGQLDHLGINHQHPQVARRVPIDQARDDGIDTDRFAGP
ncbi:MAG: hypothetical protein WEC54_05710, partial [Gemmatimonadales bacterium]